jgi:hypothetical protein
MPSIASGFMFFLLAYFIFTQSWVDIIKLVIMLIAFNTLDSKLTKSMSRYPYRVMISSSVVWMLMDLINWIFY